MENEHDVDVWHDYTGRIIAWGHTVQGSKVAIKAIPLAKPDQAVITVRLSVKDLPRLHETHCVDLGSKRLIQKKAG
jgi:hypothetical protein